MVKRAVVKELLNESACSHSATKKAGCDSVKPGATSGGCAFEGAQISLFPYADAAHIVHSPATCLNSSWETRATKTSYGKRDFTQMGFTTDVNTNDVIFGGEKKLEDSIEYVVTKYHPEAVFVYSTCVTAMIGDDIEAVSKRAQEKFQIPVVPVDVPGFTGSKNLGSRLAGEAVLKYLVGTKEPEYTTDFDINLIGEYNVTGDMWQYTHLLEKLGIRILSTLSGDGRAEKIRTAHRAKLNVIVCAKSLVTFTRKMEEQYGVPYISTSFYGKRDTSNGIRDIAKGLNNTELLEKAEKLIAEEEAKLEEKLAPYKELLKGKKAVLNTGGNKSWSILSALQDLGIEVVATSVRKATEDDKEKAREYIGEGILMENPGKEQAKIIDDTNADILLAGGRSLYTALKKQIAFLDVNQEKKVSYGGYEGLVNLAQDLVNSLSNPVFKTAGKDAPWA